MTGRKLTAAEAAAFKLAMRDPATRRSWLGAAVAEIDRRVRERDCDNVQLLADTAAAVRATLRPSPERVVVGP